MRFISNKLIAAMISFFLLGIASTTSAQDFVWAPEFPVGAELPELAAQDQNGELRRFEDLTGENGMLFMLSRSFDW